MNQNFLNEQMEKLIADIEAKKRKVIVDRLKELGIAIDVEAEIKKRFKKLAYEIGPIHGHENWFYNNGTDSGIKIVTFVQRQQDYLKENNGKYSIGMSLDYF